MQKEKLVGLSVVLGAALFIASPVFADNAHHVNQSSQEKKDFMMKRDDKTGKNWRWWEKRDTNEDRNLSAKMNGEQEVPGPGDPDGKGEVKLRVKPGKNELCVEMHVANIDQATAAHIHKGSKGVAGPAVLPLPLPDANGQVNSCVTAAKDVLKDIKKNTAEYYVNVHTSTYPDGAVRGQLHN